MTMRVRNKNRTCACGHKFKDHIKRWGPCTHCDCEAARSKEERQAA